MYEDTVFTQVTSVEATAVYRKTCWTISATPATGSMMPPDPRKQSILGLQEIDSIDSCGPSVSFRPSLSVLEDIRTKESSLDSALP